MRMEQVEIFINNGGNISLLQGDHRDNEVVSLTPE